MSTREQFTVGDYCQPIPPDFGRGINWLVVDLLRGKEVAADRDLLTALLPVWRRIAAQCPEELFLVVAQRLRGAVHEQILLAAECRLVKKSAQR